MNWKFINIIDYFHNKKCQFCECTVESSLKISSYSIQEVQDSTIILNLQFMYSKLCLTTDLQHPLKQILQRAILCFFCKFPVPCRFPKVIQQLLTSSSSSSCHFYFSFYLSFSNMFQKTVSTEDVTKPVSLLSIVCRIFLSFFTYVILIHFSLHWCT